MLKKIIYLWLHKKGWCKPFHAKKDGDYIMGKEVMKGFCPFLASVYKDLKKEERE